MTHVAYESELRSVVRSSLHLCLGNVVTTGRAVVYYARAAHTFRAGIKCQHCTQGRRSRRSVTMMQCKAKGTFFKPKALSSIGLVHLAY